MDHTLSYEAKKGHGASVLDIMEQILIHHLDVDPESKGGISHLQDSEQPGKGKGGEGGEDIEKKQYRRGQGRTGDIGKGAGKQIQFQNIHQKVSAWDEAPLDP